MENLKKELEQKVKDLEYFIKSLNDYVSSIEMFTKETRNVSEVIDTSVEMIGKDLKTIMESDYFISSNIEIDNRILNCENNIKLILKSLKERVPTEDRILYCEDSIKFMLQLLEEKGLLPGSVNENKTINLSNLPAGKYTLKYENEDGTETVIDSVVIK